MSGGRKKSDDASSSESTASRRPLSLRIFLCVLVIGGLFVGMAVAWRWVGDRIATDPSYEVSLDDFEVTAPPDWVKEDITADIAKFLPPRPLDIRQPDLTVRVAQAYARHPWVANVRSVVKRRPRVIVELDYRRPVAVVEFVSQDGKRWLYPVDGKGILLPPQDFTKEQAGKLCRINVGATMHAGPVGSPWGDSRVHGAARIAEVLAPYWADLGLYRIEMVGAGSAVVAPTHMVYDLVTRKGTRVAWGHSPGDEVTREPNADAKLQRLRAHVKTGQDLDSLDGSVSLDLRTPPPAGDRTATASGEGQPVR